MTNRTPRYDDNSDDRIENANMDALQNFAASDIFSGYPLDNTDLLQLGSGIAELDAGTDSNKPSAGTADRFYLATDTNLLYYDNGTSWSAIAGAGDSNNRLPSTVYRDIINTNTITIDGRNEEYPLEFIDGASHSGTDTSISVNLSDGNNPHFIIYEYDRGAVQEDLLLRFDGDGSSTGNYIYRDNADNEFSGQNEIQLINATSNQITAVGKILIHRIDGSRIQVQHSAAVRLGRGRPVAVYGSTNSFYSFASADFHVSTDNDIDKFRAISLEANNRTDYP